MTRFLAAILFPVILGWGWWGVWKPIHQAGQIISNWTLVEVERTTRIVRRGGPKLNRGMPRPSGVQVSYRYKVGDRQIMLPPKDHPPLEEQGPILQKMAEALNLKGLGAAVPNEVVDTVNAYANPDQTEELYFDYQRPKRLGLWLVLSPLIGLMVCVIGLLVGQPHTDPSIPIRTKKKPWRRLTQPRTTRRAIVEWIVMGIVWGAMVSPVCSMYFRVYQPATSEARISATVAGSLTLLPVAVVSLYIWVLLNFKQPRVYIDTGFLTRGDTVAVSVHQPFRGRRQLKTLRIGLICMMQYTRQRGRHTVTRSTPVHTDWETLFTDRRIEAEEVLKAQHRFRVPLEAPPTTPPDQWNSFGSLVASQLYSWHLRVELDLPWVPKLKADYPVRVV